MYYYIYLTFTHVSRPSSIQWKYRGHDVRNCKIKVQAKTRQNIALRNISLQCVYIIMKCYRTVCVCVCVKVLCFHTHNQWQWCMTVIVCEALTVIVCVRHCVTVVVRARDQWSVSVCACVFQWLCVCTALYLVYK